MYSGGRDTLRHGPVQGLLLQFLEGACQDGLRAATILRNNRRVPGVVVFKKFAKRYENLPDIQDPFDTGPELYCYGLIVNPQNIAILHPYSRSFNRINRNYAACLTRAFGLHLGADSKELSRIYSVAG